MNPSKNQKLINTALVFGGVAALVLAGNLTLGQLYAAKAVKLEAAAGVKDPVWHFGPGGPYQNIGDDITGVWVCDDGACEYGSITNEERDILNNTTDTVPNSQIYPGGNYPAYPGNNSGDGSDGTSGGVPCGGNDDDVDCSGGTN